MPIKVLLADDAQVTRRAIRQLLDSEPKIQIVGEASDFAGVIQLADELKPDVVVMDLRMPNGTRLNPATVKAHLASPGTRLLAISFAIDNESKAAAEDFGAETLLDKVCLGEMLIPAILQPSIANQISAR